MMRSPHDAHPGHHHYIYRGGYCLSSTKVIRKILMADYVFYAFAVVGPSPHNSLSHLQSISLTKQNPTPEIHHGLSHPQKTLPAPETKTQLKALWLTVPFYNLSLILTKLSMLVLYMRIFPTPTFLLTSRIISAVIVVLGLWMVVSSFVFCVPVSAFWNTGLEGRCLPEVVWYLNASLQIATDVTIVVFPMPVLGSLKLPGREK
ncbi:integral membrane protein, partial [Aspergillus sclerotialis]